MHHRFQNLQINFFWTFLNQIKRLLEIYKVNSFWLFLKWSEHLLWSHL